MRLVATIALTLAGGLLVIVILYLPVPRDDGDFFCCPVNWVYEPGGIDPSTGEVRPAIVSVYDGTPAVVKRYAVIEYHLDPVIPYPVGFVAGSLLTLTVITIAGRRRSKAASNPAIAVA
jgi:hypothetical protein